MVRRRTFGDGESDLKLKERKKVPSISYFTLFTFASKWDKILIFVSTVATFVAGITLPYAITIVAGTFQDMVTYQKSVFANNTNDEEFLRKMHIFGVKYSSIGVILFLGGYLGAALMNVTAINQIFKMRQAYLRAALNQDLAYYDVEKSGHFASRMADDVMKVEEGIGDKVSSLVYNFTVCIGCVTMAIYKGWKLALLCLTTAPITFLLVGITGKIASRISKKVTIASSSASAIAQEAISSVRTVYAFNGQEKALDSYRIPLSEVRKRNIRKDIFTGLSVGFLFFCIFSSYALSFYLGVYLIINDPENYNADVMFSVFFGVLTGMSNLGAVGTLVGSFGGAKGAGAQIFHLLNNKPTINPLLDVGLKPATSEGNIDLKNVIFFYPSRPGVTVLNGVSLEVKHGQSVALVGHSGCGKSTIIQLILRFYDVASGSVSFDGRNIKDLSVCWLRSRIGLVGQEPVLFSATIKENILYGRENATDEEVETAAKMANAHQFIVRLPKGYNTLVGERGASLSGGQKQRIAIARALIKNPLILLLDEATSALDSSSEAKVQLALEKAAAGRTTIVVAHRLSTIRHVNMIHVMKQGAVVESGSHQELMAKKGQYYEMVKLQEPDIEVTKEKQVERENSATEYEATEKVETETEKDERKQDKMSFWRVVALNRPEWKSITVGSICSTAVGFTMPIFIVAFGDLFGSMSDPDTTKMMEKAKEIAVICILLGLVMGVCNLLESVSFGLAGAYLTERLRVRMFQHMMRQQMSYYDDRNNSTGALCARLSSEAAHVQQATGQRIGILLQGVGSISLGLILAMTHEWRVGAVAMCFLPLLIIVIYYQAKTTKDESKGNLATVENSTKIAVEAVSNIRTVASLGREKRIVSEYMSQLEKNLRISRRSAHCRGVVQGISRSMFNFINAAALTYGGHLIVSDGVAYNDILITTQSLQIASGQAQNAFTYAPDFQKGIIAAERIVAFLRTAPTICDPEVPVVRGYKSQGEATFQTVEFSYPTRKKIKVLQGIDLKVESGKTVALVGHSGCGKSTIIQLLQRFYDPDFGRVFMDSYPITKLRISELRQSFGLVSQEPVLFDCSIRENIAYGDNSRKVPDEEVFDVARQANIHEFIVSLPEGYNTNIGSKGVQLSGGQKQRVAIARALVRKPMILLLDEATSALDSESEKVVVEALERARSGRTCVIVAHRLSTVRDAHCICVVDGGRVAELGTHEQLLAKNGFYHKLYNTNV